MKVAITGANGFLGRYLVEACLEAGYEVLAFIRKTADVSHLPKSDKLNIIHVNYGDLVSELSRIKDEYGAVDYFIHNAGKTTSVKLEDYENINTQLTGKLVDAITESDFLKEKLIYISSYTAHGPVGVDKPVSAYGASKKRAEELIQKSKYPTLIFRPTAIYGAGDVAFLPLFQAARKGLYPVVRQEQVMTMIHSADMAAAVTHYMESDEGIIHVNDGQSYTHTQFRELLTEVVGKKVRNLKIPAWLSKVSLWLSDLWCKLSGKPTNLTLEKFEEISHDWDLHNYENLTHSKAPIAFDLRRGFEDAYKYYTENKLL